MAGVDQFGIAREGIVTVDILGMLEEKTRGNLTADEQQLLEHLLYDLRIRYVARQREVAVPPEKADDSK